MAMRSEWVRCNNPRCKSCPHGPYWYEYWREGKTTKKRYWGKTRPGGAHTYAPESSSWWEDIFNDRTASLELALKILELKSLPKTASELTKHYRKRILDIHPDRAGDAAFSQAMNAAYGYCKTFFK